MKSLKNTLGVFFLIAFQAAYVCWLVYALQNYPNNVWWKGLAIVGLVFVNVSIFLRTWLFVASVKGEANDT